MGLGLSQMGELSFILLSAGYAAGLIDADAYNAALLLAIGSLILTPPLLRFGLRQADPILDEELEGRRPSRWPTSSIRHALVVGIGPVGRQVVSQLETRGLDVVAVDLSPVNLHPLAQVGLATIAGDARDTLVLRRAGAAESALAVVTVPDDRVALEIVRALRRQSTSCRIVVRCRYQLATDKLQQAGAQAVVSEEAEASAALLELLEGLDADGPNGG
jgi:CPA2 family monovalent cation:H+ antiporter-2